MQHAQEERCKQIKIIFKTNTIQFYNLFIKGKDTSGLLSQKKVCLSHIYSSNKTNQTANSIIFI